MLETAWSPLASIPTVRQALHETSPDVAMAGVEPFADIIARSRAELSFAMILIMLAASVALILGVVGVYAVIAYGVAQRRLELAVRLALGATAGELTRMIVRQGRLPIVSGIAVGIVAASGASQLLRALLFGVSPGDPLVHGVVAAMLFAIGTVACWIPARRAARVSPIEGLRSQA